MDWVIPQRLRSKVFLYQDDLLVISKTFEEHMEFFSEVAKSLRLANLTIGLIKCKCCFKHLRFLGYIIGGGSLLTDPEKVQAILQNPVPKSMRQLNSYLGTAGWYRRFIWDFSGLSSPQTDCLKEKAKLKMTDEEVASFHALVHLDF